MPLEPVEARDSANARSRAQAAAAQHGGAIAFSRTGEPATGDFSDAVMLATYGKLDHGTVGE